MDEITKVEKLVAARDDFEEIRAAVEEFVRIEIRTKPQKIDVSCMEATAATEYSHSEWLEYWMHGENQETEDPGAGLKRHQMPDHWTHSIKAKARAKEERAKGKAKARVEKATAASWVARVHGLSDVRATIATW